jgi:peptide/nickel transport system substrate-binding protein
MSHPVTKNQKLRQAMSLAIDRQALVKTLWKDKGVVPNSLQFANYGEPMYMPDVKTIEYNPEKAAQLVKESGYDGTPVVISNQTNYYTYADLAAQAIMDMWKKVGINAQLNQLDSFPKDISPLMVRTWSNPLHYPDPMGVFATHWTEFSWPATSKFYVPQNPDYKKYYETARYSTNVEERKAAYKQLLLTTAEEGGFFPLYQPYEYFGMRKDISWEIPRNYRPYTLPLRAGEIKIGA